MKINCIYSEKGQSVIIGSKIKGEYIEFPPLKMAFIFPEAYQKIVKNDGVIYFDIHSLIPMDKKPCDQYIAVSLSKVKD